MKLSARTIQVLKSFAQINPSLIFTPGNEIKTVSPQKTILAKATIAETIPQQFAIYDLVKFLGVLSLFNDPDLEINEKFITIKSGSSNLNFVYCPPDMVVQPPKKMIELSNDCVEKTITSATLQSVMKAVGVLQLPDVAFVGKDGKLTMEALDTKPNNPNQDNISNNFSIDIGDTVKTFKMVIKAENLKIMNEEYVLKIAPQGLCHFKGSDIEYWIACEENSTYMG
jgi:gp45 sliding clamp, C terminal